MRVSVFVHLLICAKGDDVPERNGHTNAQLQLDNTEGKVFFVFCFFVSENGATTLNGESPAPKPLVPAIIYPQWNTDIRGWDTTTTTTTTTTTQRLSQAAKLCYKLHSALYL